MQPKLTNAASPPPARGFTLIELITVLLIAGVLTAIGVPMLSEFVADQRVRTVASDIAGDIALARATAIEASRRVYIERTSATWNEGWRVYVDLNNSGTYDAGEEIKVFNGFSTSRMYVCSNVADFAANVIFRPDGRIVRTTVANANDGIYVVDTMGDLNNCNNKIRGLLFGVAGRVKVEVMKSASAACPGVAPPC